MAINLKCTNEDGFTITFDSEVGMLRLLDFNPSGAKSTHFTTKAFGEDGDTFRNSQLEPLDLPLEFWVLASSENKKYELIKQINMVFNPKKTITLTYTYPLGSYSTDVQVESSPMYYTGNDNRNENIQKGLVHLKAHRPYWHDANMNEIPLTVWQPLFEFDFDFGDGVGLEMGTKISNSVVNNAGDVPAWCTIDIYGPVVNPTIYNRTTGEKIAIRQTITSGQHIQISTEPGNKGIDIVNMDGTRINVLNWIGVGSTFFKLPMGMNIIEYTADQYQDDATVIFSYQKQFINL